MVESVSDESFQCFAFTQLEFDGTFGIKMRWETTTTTTILLSVAESANCVRLSGAY